MALADEKCKACEGGVEPLSAQDIATLAPQISSDWQIEEKRILRSFKFPDFVSAMDFANKITIIAQEENHHPNLHISWGKCVVELSTHSIGGLSTNDFVVAAKIDRI